MLVAERGARSGRGSVSVMVVVRLLTSTLDLARVLEGRRETLEGFLCSELAALGRRGTAGGKAQSIQSASSRGVVPGAGVKTKGLLEADESVNVLVGSGLLSSAPGRIGDATVDVVLENVLASNGKGNFVCVGTTDPPRPIAAAIVA